VSISQSVWRLNYWLDKRGILVRMSGGATHPYIPYGDQTAYGSHPSFYQTACKRLYHGDLSDKGTGHFPASSVVLKQTRDKSCLQLFRWFIRWWLKITEIQEALYHVAFRKLMRNFSKLTSREKIIKRKENVWMNIINFFKILVGKPKRKGYSRTLVLVWRMILKKIF